MLGLMEMQLQKYNETIHIVESLLQGGTNIKYPKISYFEIVGIFLFLVGGGVGRIKKGDVKYSLAKYSSITNIVDSCAFKAIFLIHTCIYEGGLKIPWTRP